MDLVEQRDLKGSQDCGNLSKVAKPDMNRVREECLTTKKMANKAKN